MAVYRYLKHMISPLAFRIDDRRRRENANARAVAMPRQKLTAEEKRQFNTIWKGWSPVSHEFYKAFGLPFDARMVPNDYYDFAEHVLNLRWASFFLQHKCCLQYFIPEEHRPKTILRKIDGHYIDAQDVEMAEADAVVRLRTLESFIVKVARGSGGGIGVRKISRENVDTSSGFWSQLLEPDDLIFQEVLRQHPFMAQFNPDSVNTCRIITLNINGSCTTLGSILRMGAVGSPVDNLTSGGGVLVGIGQNGRIHDFGVRKDFNKAYASPTGVKFSGLMMPEWELMKETVIGFHRQIPFVNLIGWDVALDETGRPTIIEINLDSAMIEAVQIFSGPIFGDRLEEVRAYIDEKTLKLKHAVVTY
jgi:hypothetical protein